VFLGHFLYIETGYLHFDYAISILFVAQFEMPYKWYCY